MYKLNKCIHTSPVTQDDGSTIEEIVPNPLHKLKAIAQMYGVSEVALVRRLDQLPHSHEDRPSGRKWVFVSDDDLREWFRLGVRFRAYADFSRPLELQNEISLSCGHVVKDIPPIGAPQLKERRKSPKPRVRYGCRHATPGALHSLRALAGTARLSTDQINQVAALARLGRVPCTLLEFEGGVRYFFDDGQARELLGDELLEARGGALACGWTLAGAVEGASGS